MDSITELDLPTNDFVVAGSAPLLLHGLRDSIDDIDIVARGSAWRRALQLGEVQPAPFGDVEQVLLSNGRIQILSGWFRCLWTVDELIQAADVVSGINFVPLAVTAVWKRLLNRDLDVADISRIESAIGSQ